MDVVCKDTAAPATRTDQALSVSAMRQPRVLMLHLGGTLGYVVWSSAGATACPVVGRFMREDR
jgi:hypothetical protein